MKRVLCESGSDYRVLIHADVAPVTEFGTLSDLSTCGYIEIHGSDDRPNNATLNGIIDKVGSTYIRDIVLPTTNLRHYDELRNLSLYVDRHELLVQKRIRLPLGKIALYRTIDKLPIAYVGLHNQEKPLVTHRELEQAGVEVVDLFDQANTGNTIETMGSRGEILASAINGLRLVLNRSGQKTILTEEQALIRAK